MVRIPVAWPTIWKLLAIEGLCRDFSALVIRSPKREGRIRSAERTEVHLIETIRFYELTFCP